MTFDITRADALEQLATAIEGLSVPAYTIDREIMALVAEPMQVIEGRTLGNYSFSLNVTAALQARPKHWYMELEEHNLSNPGTSFTSPVFCGLLYTPNLAMGYTPSNQAYGATLGLAACAAICRTWGQIVRLWLANNYPPVSVPVT